MANYFDPATGMPTTRRRSMADTFNPAPQIPVSSFIDMSGTKPAPLDLAYSIMPGGTLPASPTYGGAGGVSSPMAPANTSFGPDLYAQLESDPLYVQDRANLAAQRVSDLASRTAARQRAIALFGEVPDFGGFGGLGEGFESDINETTRGLAAQNTAAGLSTTARIEKAHAETLQRIKDQLAARGILSSGELPYQYDREGLAHRQVQFDSRQQLLDYLAGVQSAFVEAERQRQAALQNAAYAAAGRLRPSYGGGGGGEEEPAPWEPWYAPNPGSSGITIDNNGYPTNVFPGDFKGAAVQQKPLTPKITTLVKPTYAPKDPYLGSYKPRGG